MTLDARQIRITLDFGDGSTEVFERFAIRAKGKKYASATQNQCTVQIANLSRDRRGNLLTKAGPFVSKSDRVEIKMTVEAGRKSWGYTTLFVGDVTNIGMTQPPDIWAVIKAQTKDYAKGTTIMRAFGPKSSFSVIAGQVATDLGLELDFQATDKLISGFHYRGALTKQVDWLEEFGTYDVFIDDETLHIKNQDTALPIPLKIVSQATGMVGIPEITEYGVRAKWFIDRTTRLGAPVRVISDIYQTTTGDYTIFMLDFEVANRDKPFYFTGQNENPRKVELTRAQRVRIDFNKAQN